MSNQTFELNAVVRGDELQGKGASRRLRKQNLVPAIVYGADKEPASIAIRYNELIKSLETESFFSHILTINVEGQGTEEVVIKALQRHPDYVDTFLDKLVNWDYANAKYKGQEAGVEK